MKSGWAEAALGQVVVPVSKCGPIKQTLGTFSYVDLSAIDHGLKVVGAPSQIRFDEAPSRAKQVLQAGDVLVSTVRPNLNAVARVEPELDGAIGSTGFCVLRPKQQEVDGRYLFNWVRSPRFVDEMTRLATGASYPAVSDRIVMNSLMPLPPIEEQRRIATVLDAADALRTKRRQAIAKLDTLTQAIFIDMFGDPVRNERGWEFERLDHVCQTVQIGPFGSLLHKHDYITGGVPLVNPVHIVQGTIRISESTTVEPKRASKLEGYRLRAGDVVMGRRGEMGRCAVVGANENGYLCGSGSLFLRPDPDRLTPAYLHRALSGPEAKASFERQALGVTMPNLNSSIVGAFRIGMPPVEAQARFDRASDRVALRSADMAASLREQDDLFASLQQRAFRGEL